MAQPLKECCEYNRLKNVLAVRCSHSLKVMTKVNCNYSL